MDFLIEIFNKIKESFQISMEALQQLIYNLESQTEAIDTMTTKIRAGAIQTGEFNLVEFISAFRWIVGDLIFMGFYLVILTGLAFTIYNIIMFIKTHALPGGIIDKIFGWFM